MANLHKRIAVLEAASTDDKCRRVLLDRHNVITAISRGFDQFIGNVFTNELKTIIQSHRVIKCNNRELVDGKQ